MSVNKRIKYFKKLAIILTIFWSLLTAVFAYYQLYNEAQHTLKNTFQKAKGVSAQSSAFIFWAYEEKARSMNDEQRNITKNSFTLKEILYNLAKENNMEYSINSQYHDIENAPLLPDLKKTLLKMKDTKSDQHTIYTKDDETYLFYAKPLLANESCLGCHVHDEEKVDAFLGYTVTQIKIPTFKEVNPKSFYFLIMMYCGTWILGLFAIWWIHLKGKNYLNEKTKLYEESMYALVDMMEKRDSYTAGHSQRVAEYSRLLLQAMKYSAEDAELIYKAGMLHDIGKIEIPDAILLKPEKLLPIEYLLIQNHSQASFELLCREPFSSLARIVLHHHERYDGTGYPDKLKGSETPFFSQVIAIADAFDAMTTNRSYRKSLSKEVALAILEEESGKQFNPLIVSVAKEVFKTVILPSDTTQMPKDLLEEMRFSYYFKDQLTGFYNLNYLKFIVAHLDDYKSKLIRIDHLNCIDFSSYNKKNGWREGNKLLCDLANAIHQTYPDAIIMRVYSDKFYVLHMHSFTPKSCESVFAIGLKSGLKMTCKHLDIDDEEEITFEMLEERLLHLED